MSRTIGVLLGLPLLLAASVASGDDLSCYRTLEALRIARDQRAARCGGGTTFSTAQAQCVANNERTYRAAVAALNCNPPALQPKEKSFVKRVTVPARAELVDTGIDIWSGCTIGVWSTGLWSNAGAPSLGAGGFVGYKHPGTILADGDLASLVGVLSGPDSNHPGHGNEAIVMFPIGEASRVDVGPGNPRFLGGPAVGRLFLTMNDVGWTYDDNGGSLTVDVTVPTTCAEIRTRVFASAEWTDTKIAIPYGKELVVASTGKWSNVAGTPTLTAAGSVGYRHPSQRYADADFASLVGSLGGPSFGIGDATNVAVTSGGVLKLGMNDLPGSFADNVGALDVVIRGREHCTPIVVGKGVARCVRVGADGTVDLYLNPNHTTVWQGSWLQHQEPDDNFCGPTAGRNFFDWYGIANSYQDLGRAMHTNEWDRLPAAGTALAICGFEPICALSLASAISEMAIKAGSLPKFVKETLNGRRPAGYSACGGDGSVLRLDEIRASLASGNPVAILESKGTNKLHWAVIVGITNGPGGLSVVVANSDTRSWNAFTKDWSLSRVGGSFVRKVMKKDLLGLGLKPYTNVRWCGLPG